MATVNGQLTDCGLGSMSSRGIELVFTLNEPSTAGDVVLVTEPIKADISGAGFSVILQDTETMDQADRFYRVAARWLDSSGQYARVDFPEWRLFVPIGGGRLADLIGNFSLNPLMVFWQTEEPDPWPVGAVYINTNSGDINRKDS